MIVSMIGQKMWNTIKPDFMKGNKMLQCHYYEALGLISARSLLLRRRYHSFELFDKEFQIMMNISIH